MALSKAGHVFAAPGNSDKLLIFDPVSKAVEGIDITSVATGVHKFSGICSCNGKVFAVPYNPDKLLIFDPVSKAVEGIDITSVAKVFAKFSGICSYNGMVFAVPYNSNKLLIFDPMSKAVEGIDITSIAKGGRKFTGICSCNGKVYAAPHHSDKLLIFDPVSKAVEGIDITSVATGAWKFTGICSSNGKVFAAPGNSDKLLIFDPVSKAVEGFDITSVATGAWKFTGICRSNGKVYAAPGNSDKLLIFDPVSKAVEGIDITSVATGVHKFTLSCSFSQDCEQVLGGRVSEVATTHRPQEAEDAKATRQEEALKLKDEEIKKKDDEIERLTMLLSEARQEAKQNLDSALKTAKPEGLDYKVWLQPESIRPIEAKKSGAALGAVYMVSDRWLGKVGMAQEQDVLTNKSESRSVVRKGINVDAVKEKIAIDTYADLSNGCFVVPQGALAFMPILNDFTRQHELGVPLVELLNQFRREPGSERVEDGVHFMSKFLRNFTTFKDCEAREGGTTISFDTFVVENDRPPEWIAIKGQSQSYQLRGLMEVLAVARVLADTDVLGGSFENAGTVVTEGNGDADSAKVDTGCSYNFEGADNKLWQTFHAKARFPTRLQDPKDIQYGNQCGHVIKWASLLPRQQDAFKKKLFEAAALLTRDKMNELIFRDGAFNRYGEERIKEPNVLAMIDRWTEYVNDSIEPYQALA